MKDDIILKIESLSKQYRLGTVGTGTLSHDINRAWAKLRGKEDPYLKIGAVNDRSSTASSDYVWALKDINFEVKRGEIVGIIGKNGAGKSTLLKILSRVTSPTTGSIKVGGRMASLLEVGTGMHPELTGRENIYLNGAILGMTKAEISSKIDEIIDFSGCQMYIDTPVKRYSSGMGVRLGFAVAAFLEPDILVVDEVLAVGDAEFQKKAIGKMQDISSTGGRTVLFVSHNMTSIKNLCSRLLVLEHGKVVFNGQPSVGISQYFRDHRTDNNPTYLTNSSKIQKIKRVEILNEKKESCSNFMFDEQVFIKTDINVTQENIAFAINIRNDDFQIIFTSEMLNVESGELNAKIPHSFLMKGKYYLDVHIYRPNVEFLDSVVDQLNFNIISLPENYAMYNDTNCGIVKSPVEWL